MDNLLILLPIFGPLAGGIISLLLARFVRVQGAVAMIAAIIAWVASLLALWSNWLDPSAPLVYELGAWAAPFGIVLVVDLFSGLFGVMCSTVMTAGVLYALGCHDKAVNTPAFMPLFLAIYTGLLGTMYSGDLFTIFVFLELMVLASISLVGISDHRLGVEAAIKYLFISGLGTLFLLLGIGSMYASFGTLNLADIAQSLAVEGRPLLAQQAGLVLMSAFLLKSAVFPFHFWQPDFHTTAPTPVHAVLSSVVVKVGVYGIIRLTTLLFTEEAGAIQDLLLVLGIVGIFFGGLGALRTYDGKRMLAYSTFGQIGFILVGIGWGTPLALLGAIVYAFNHAFIKSAMLMLMGAISSNTVAKKAEYTEIEGVGKKIGALAGVIYILGGLSLAGVPPLNGFISKLALVQGGIDAQGWWAVGLVVGGGILTLLYMMRTWQHIFQKDKPDHIKLKEQGDNLLAPALLVAACVVLGLYATPLLDVASATVEQIGNPEIYIIAVLGG
ncbi:MAG: hypothetical protein GYB68_11915 [Chloroflexi bacterium]|nr:hypothetical protein [Chloroflexota bacterium]